MNIKQLLFGKQLARIQTAQYQRSTQKWLPIADIRDGIILTKDGRYVKILEVLPVNFELKSPIERQNIIYYYASYLKIAPDNLQVKIITQKADIEGYVSRLWQQGARHFWRQTKNDKASADAAHPVKWGGEVFIMRFWRAAMRFALTQSLAILSQPAPAPTQNVLGGVRPADFLRRVPGVSGNPDLSLGHVSATRKVPRVCADAHEVILANRSWQFHIPPKGAGDAADAQCAPLRRCDDAESGGTSRTPSPTGSGGGMEAR